jgi:uncharacterized protein YjbI with pentapeptide repeats
MRRFLLVATIWLLATRTGATPLTWFSKSVSFSDFGEFSRKLAKTDGLSLREKTLLRGELRDIVWTRADLRGTRFRQMWLRNVAIRKSDFRATRIIGSRFDGNDLLGSRFEGALITDTKLVDSLLPASIKKDAILVNVVFDRCRFEP